MKQFLLACCMLFSFGVFAQTVTDKAVLDGSNSKDDDGTIVAYSWKQISGPAVTAITNASAVKDTVVFVIAGLYSYELTVTDNKGLIGKGIQEVEVYAANKPPRAVTSARIVIQLPK